MGKPKIERSTLVGGRDQLADVCNMHGLRRGVEVGTELGLFASAFLSKWRGDVLYCIDNYDTYGLPGVYSESLSARSRLPDLITACINLQPFKERARIVVGTSPEVASEFVGAEIDFVYIDASHDYESVKKDIDAWWAILKPGGIMSGHDYLLEVQKAVDEFSAETGQKIELTSDYNMPLSWFTVKPQ